MKKALNRKEPEIINMPSGIRGNISNITGNVSGIWGNVTGIKGNVTDITGNIDDCELTTEERIQGVDINDLIL